MHSTSKSLQKYTFFFIHNRLVIFFFNTKKGCRNDTLFTYILIRYYRIEMLWIEIFLSLAALRP